MRRCIVFYSYNQFKSWIGELFISKREIDTDDQCFVSYPETAHTEGFQTMIYAENGYEFFGPYNTEKDVY